ncbi:histidine phosphatase family protein [Promicromonospora umidemergens]|uniref:histidine phosphatase family protein n=1 Tax=Promicromonospora umidemergens TaxID=629679 RepID=UPI0020A2C8BD|nr:histidine phosphatase family protein [Promicromonospora umidemergens]
MTTLLLVRHGATSWTHDRRLQGRTDIDLSDIGRSDVAALGPAVAAWAPRSLVVSPLRRTRSTAELLSTALRDSGEAELPVPVVEAGWTEHGLGEWEGLTPHEIGDDYARWRAGALVPPGGEPRDDIRARVAAAVRSAAALPGPVLVVTHGGTIRAVLAACVGLTAERIEPVAPPSLTVLDVADPHASEHGPSGVNGARLRHFNIR